MHDCHECHDTLDCIPCAHLLPKECERCYPWCSACSGSQRCQACKPSTAGRVMPPSTNEITTLDSSQEGMQRAIEYYQE